MPQPLDLVSRFPVPDFAPGEEQRLLDWERQIADRDARVSHLIATRCQGWTEDDFVYLAKLALEEFLHMRNSRLKLVQAYELIDDVVEEMHKMPEVDDGPTST